MKYQIGCFSLTGDRSMNQDRCASLQDPEAVLLALGDGMGGHPGGDKAAEILVSSCQRLFERADKPAPAPDQLLRQVFRQSHESVVAYGSAQSPAIEPRTTAVVALIQGDMAYWAHTGDSRLYLLRAGRVVARTQDHSYVEELQQRGEISAEERDSHPYRHYVTRALGGQEEIAQPTLGKPTGLEPGDVITHFDGEAVRDGRLTMHGVALLKPGESVEISVLRGTQSMELTAVVGVLNQSDAEGAP